MTSAFSSVHAHRSFDVLFKPSVATRPSGVVWNPEAVFSEEQFVGAFPWANVGVDDGLSLQEMSCFNLAVSTESGSPSSRLKHISVRFLSLS